MQKLLATWDGRKDCWISELPTNSRRKKTGLYEHWGVFSETWPTSGTMRNGKVYTRDASDTYVGPVPNASELAISDSESSSSQQTDTPMSPGSLLLKTPTANLGGNGGPQHPDLRKRGGMDQRLRMRSYSLLPTPRVSDANGGGAHGTGGLDLRTAIATYANR